MVSKKITVSQPEGLHARPASAIVKTVKESSCAVSLSTASKTVRGDSMLGILSLGLKHGTEVTVSVDGPDEAAVLENISAQF